MGPLISAAELRERPGEVTVLDVRYRMGGPPGREEHAAGHVPGASYVDLDADLAGRTGEGRHPLPDPGDLAAAMRRAGVRRNRPVVVYDDWGGRAAARCWWLLRWMGKDDVQVLDGGWKAWLAAGGPTEEGEVDAPEGDVEAGSGKVPVRGPGNVRTAAVLVDARAPERFRGEVEPVDPVAGHIPGAVNVPTEANLGPDGRFRSETALREAYAEVLGADGDVTVYCGSGVTACHDVLALEVLGVRAALYPGSWSGWVSDPSRPVATGPA